MQGVSPHSKAIPRVKPYTNGDQKKFVVFDAEDIVCLVSLVNAVDQSDHMYVISNGDAFDEDMSQLADKVLLHRIRHFL